MLLYDTAPVLLRCDGKWPKLYYAQLVYNNNIASGQKESPRRGGNRYFLCSPKAHFRSSSWSSSSSSLFLLPAINNIVKNPINLRSAYNNGNGYYSHRIVEQLDLHIYIYTFYNIIDLYIYVAHEMFGFIFPRCICIYIKKWHYAYIPLIESHLKILFQNVLHLPEKHFISITRCVSNSSSLL